MSASSLWYSIFFWIKDWGQGARRNGFLVLLNIWIQPSCVTEENRIAGNETPDQGQQSRIWVEGDPCKFLACLWWVMRLLERCYTGRFLVPYFILIFANVKIKDKSEYSRDLTNRKKNTNRVDQYCLEILSNYCVQLLIQHLYSSFIFWCPIAFGFGIFRKGWRKQ